MEDKGKRKKSGASYRKVKKQRVDEEAKLSNLMYRFHYVIDRAFVLPLRARKIIMLAFET